MPLTPEIVSDSAPAINQPATRKRRPPRPIDVPENHEWCSRGDHWLPSDSFSPHKTRSSGLQTNCRACQAEAVKRSEESLVENWALPRHEQTKRENVRRARQTTVAYRRGKRVLVRKLLLTPRNMNDNDLRKVLLLRTQAAAASEQVPFSLQPSDLLIPHECPVSGALLQRTVDTTWGNGMVVVRVDPAAGYVAGNVVILAQWAQERLDWTAERCQRWIDDPGHSRGMRWHHYIAVSFWTAALRCWVLNGQTLSHALKSAAAET